MSERRDYLGPYERATERHGAGFESLLWASPATQEARFDAIHRLVNLRRKRVLDVGCGRADLLDYLVRKKVRLESYVGIEGVAALAEVACEKGAGVARIVQGDFLANPQLLETGAQVVVICGSLNTMDADGFYSTLRRAYDAAEETLVFNFLCSSRLAGADYLSWHPVEEVMGFARTLSDRVRKVEDYLVGDCTVVMRKAKAEG